MTTRGLAGNVISWTTAGAVVVAGHIGLAYWLMQTEASQIAGLPDPVYVDLAPMPEAAAPLDQAETQEQAEIKPEPDPEPVEEEPEEEVADFTPPPLPELEPLPDLSTLIPPPEDAVVLTKSERPRERPDRTEPEPESEREVAKKEEPKKERRRRQPEQQQQQQEQEQEQERRTRVDAPQGQRTAAPRANAGNAPTQRQAASWRSQIESRVARHMQRTRLPGRSGNVQVMVRFTVSPGGQVTAASVSTSTGNARLDQALNRQASRLPRLPPPPSGKSTSLELPVLVQSR